MNQQDMDELTEVFVEESQEILENLTADVLELEKYVGNPALNRELVNNIFRYVHTLKGNSGLAGADKLRDLAHKLESLLDQLRKDKMELKGYMVDILFEGIDRIKAILQEVITGADQGVVIDDLVHRLETTLSGKPPEEKEAARPAPHPPKEEKAPPEKPAPPTPPIKPATRKHVALPDDIQRVLTEYEEHRLIESFNNQLTIYEAVLNLTMEGFDRIVTAVIDRLNTVGEVIAKVPSSKTLPDYDLQVRIIFAASLALETLMEFLSGLDVLAEQNFSVHLLLTPAEGEPVQPTPVKTEPVKEKIPPKEIVPPSPPAEKKPTPPIEKKPAPPTPIKVEEKKPPVTQKPSVQEETAEQAGRAAPVDLAGNTVRVDIKKLDNLMNIVGELVLAKARYVQFESEIEGIAAYKTLHDNFKRNNKLTSKKLEDLREAILQVRMVQVGSLFNRFPRIVRDLAKSHNKQIQLIIKGKETELDKAVVDEMGEPLIHLIRNAVDHGIEDGTTRHKQNKPEIGTITLNAYQEGSYIVIEVQDDGAGIQVERVRQKAIDLGLLERGVKLSDSETLGFIFHPGFSTAKTVTNTSGRGVGMDVVKLAISRLKGIIDIQTELNIGTKFIVRLPLTLAIIQVLLIKTLEHTYAIPLSSVTESFKFNPEKVEVVDEQEVTQLRDIVLPLFRLDEAFGLNGSGSHDKEAPSQTVAEDQETAAGEAETAEEDKHAEEDKQEERRQFVVIIGLAEKKIGLVVDDLLGQQEIVIKPLGRYLVNIPGFAGATTLGDGRVVLILDVVGLIEDLNRKKMVPRSRQERIAISA